MRDVRRIEPRDVLKMEWRLCKKRPVTVRAVQMEVPFEVETPSGWVSAEAGDYLMQGVDGELYPCKKRIFNNSYDFVEAQ